MYCQVKLWGENKKGFWETIYQWFIHTILTLDVVIFVPLRATCEMCRVDLHCVGSHWKLLSQLHISTFALDWQQVSASSKHTNSMLEKWHQMEYPQLQTIYFVCSWNWSNLTSIDITSKFNVQTKMMLLLFKYSVRCNSGSLSSNKTFCLFSFFFFFWQILC